MGSPHIQIATLAAFDIAGLVGEWLNAVRREYESGSVERAALQLMDWNDAVSPDTKTLDTLRALTRIGPAQDRRNAFVAEAQRRRSAIEAFAEVVRDRGEVGEWRWAAQAYARDIRAFAAAEQARATPWPAAPPRAKPKERTQTARRAALRVWRLECDGADEASREAHGRARYTVHRRAVDVVADVDRGLREQREELRSEASRRHLSTAGLSLRELSLVGQVKALDELIRSEAHHERMREAQAAVTALREAVVRVYPPRKRRAP